MNEINLVREDGKFKTVAEVEQEHIVHVLNYCHGNIARTCRELNMSRTSLYRKLKRYGLR